MVHEMMQRVAVSDRRMKLISELEYTLTAADKEALKSAAKAKFAEQSSAAFDGVSIPEFVPPDK